MIYPKFIKEDDTIGVTAPSDGSASEMDIKRLELAANQFNKRNFNVEITPNCYTSTNFRSSDGVTRARELESLFLNKNVTSIICASGGDFLNEMLSPLNFDTIKENPKWIQGYSDPTSLLFAITTNLDIATIYGANYRVFSMEPWHQSLTNNLEILKGKQITQTSFEMYRSEREEYQSGTEPYILDRQVVWKNLNNEKQIKMSGRMIGGCLDCFLDIIGTRFDNTKNFIEKYKEDGIIWYFENFGLTNEEVQRTMWHFKEAGWFKYTNGIIFGRSQTDQTYLDVSFEMALKESLDDLNIPIILNADFGHKPPQLTIINGAVASITSEIGKGTMSFELK